LFADVELRRAEATWLEILGLEVEDNDEDGLQLLQPCGALRGKRCGIYPHRPRSCRAFECRLLQDAQRGDVSADRALEHIAEAHRRIRRVQALLAQFEPDRARLPLKERCAEALAGQVGTSPEAKRKRDELEAAMSAVETLIRKTFL
jgi:Fe-S-cluster containining protein